MWALPSQASGSKWSWGPPPKAANSFPSIESATDVAPVEVQVSWIIVGALHGTGDDGLVVNPVMRGPVAAGTVVVPLERIVVMVDTGPDEVDDVEGAASVVVEAATEVEVLVVEGAVSDFLELLHPESAASAATVSTTGPRTGRRGFTNGGYAHAPP